MNTTIFYDMKDINEARRSDTKITMIGAEENMNFNRIEKSINAL